MLPGITTHIDSDTTFSIDTAGHKIGLNLLLERYVAVQGEHFMIIAPLRKATANEGGPLVAGDAYREYLRIG